MKVGFHTVDVTLPETVAQEESAWLFRDLSVFHSLEPSIATPSCEGSTARGAEVE